MLANCARQSTQPERLLAVVGLAAAALLLGTMQLNQFTFAAPRQLQDVATCDASCLLQLPKCRKHERAGV